MCGQPSDALQNDVRRSLAHPCTNGCSRTKPLVVFLLTTGTTGFAMSFPSALRSSLNLSQFVEGRRWCPQAREGIEETRVVAGNELYNNVEIHRTCPRFYALQTAIN